MTRARVLMGDDHTLVLAGFRKLLEPEFDLVGVVEDGRKLVEMAQSLRPDVILTDISMPLLNGFDAARQIRKLAPESKIVFVTMHADPDYIAEALRLGALGYLLKRSAASELAFAIHEVLAGRTYVTPLVPKQVGAEGEETRSPVELSPRQREVLQLVAEGHANKEIARILKLSMKTVEFHKSNLSRKLNLHSTADLTKYAIQHRIVSI
ncbi:MAG: response regulator transcription factor [Acidobacteriota bacterium]|nr:response regulator transcription factor [Acidobacteriota bacterium]